MRRKIQLYIGGSLADISDQGLVLMNYSFTELQTPSAVKNSYSKQITLPGTDANARIFGHAGRVDRTTAQTGFSAGAKTPFEIRNERNEVLERGYLRLDSIAWKGREVGGYNVSLFGGLGGFFYSLTYGTGGEKMTLADLLLGNQETYYLLDSFPITKDTIGAAWERLRTRGTAPLASMWDILNFAPAYNGIPAGTFAADKAIISPGDLGLPTTQTKDSKTYSAKDGLAVLNLSGKKDEWAMKDLRSYLQRPVLSLEAFLVALKGYADENLGVDFDYSAVPESVWKGVWKTLPMIPSLGSFKKITGDGEITYQREPQDQDYIADFGVQGVPLDSTQETSIAVVPNFDNPESIEAPSAMSVWRADRGGYDRVLTFVQMVAMIGNNRIAGSEVLTLCDWISRSGQGLAQAVGFTPWVEDTIADPQAFQLGAAQASDYKIQRLSFQARAVNADKYRIYFRTYLLRTTMIGGQEALSSYVSTGFGGFNTYGNYIEAESYSVDDWSGSVFYETASEVRSGAVVDPAVLLHSDKTPADYLLSFAKMHGLVFRYDPGVGSVALMPRNAWFNDATPIDLTPRIDRAKGITIQPMALQSKWYTLAAEMVDGAFAKEYAKIYGQPYGSQRVNTGYDLDAAAVELMKGNAFRGAATILAHGPYWNEINKASVLYPSPMIDKGNTYTLWDMDDSTAEFQVPRPAASVPIDYYNALAGYDIANCQKLEFVNDKGESVDGVDVLCRFLGMKDYSSFALTDDTTEMLVLNNGVPCWDCTRQDGASTKVPIFSRYNDTEDAPVEQSLDYGIPRELDMPGVVFDTERGSLYLRYWKAYLADLLNEDTRVMKCRVDLRGLQVGADLLRRFFWYEGAVWVLNKITNYSLTTWDTAECEFVQVRDMENYMNGQIVD